MRETESPMATKVRAENGSLIHLLMPSRIPKRNNDISEQNISQRKEASKRILLRTVDKNLIMVVSGIVCLLSGALMLIMSPLNSINAVAFNCQKFLVKRSFNFLFHSSSKTTSNRKTLSIRRLNRKIHFRTIFSSSATSPLRKFYRNELTSFILLIKPRFINRNNFVYPLE